MDNQFTYRLMPHLPHPPQWLIDQIDFDAEPEVNDIGAMGHRTLTKWKGYTGVATKNIRRVFTEDYHTWIKENITADYMNASLMYCRGSPARPSTGAHTDFTRDYLLLYNVLTGGPNATLTFWQEKGKPLIRERSLEVGDYENLEMIDSVVGPANTWYLVNTRILHSTENVDSLRLNLQVSFDTTLPRELS